MDDNFIHLAGLFVAIAFGYFIGYRAGWQALADKVKENKPAEQPIAPAAPMYEVSPPVPVGDRFTYLGLQMVCVAHCVRMPMGAPLPGMTAEYVDGDGVMRGHYWTPEQFAAIRAEVQRNSAAVAER